MALTDLQKAKVRAYLGYADLFRYKNVRLEGVLNGNLSADAETLLLDDLAKVELADARLFGKALDGAGVKRVDEVEFFQGRTIADIRSIGRQAVGRISKVIGVPVFSDYFGVDGYPGDQYTEGSDQLVPSGGGGGMGGRYQVG